MKFIILILLSFIKLTAGESVPLTQYIHSTTLVDGMKFNEQNERLMGIEIAGDIWRIIIVTRDGSFKAINGGKLLTQEGKRVETAVVKVQFDDDSKTIPKAELLQYEVDGKQVDGNEYNEAKKRFEMFKNIEFEIKPESIIISDKNGKEDRKSVFLPGSFMELVNGDLANKKITEPLLTLSINPKVRKIVVHFDGEATKEKMEEIAEDIDGVYDVILYEVSSEKYHKVNKLAYYYNRKKDTEMKDRLLQTLHDIYGNKNDSGLIFREATLEECTSREYREYADFRE